MRRSDEKLHRRVRYVDGYAILSLGGDVYVMPRHKFWGALAKDWEPTSWTFFERYCVPNTTTIDIGAWIGPTALMATALGSRTVRLIEPNPPTLGLLNETVALDPDLHSTWQIVDACVATTSGWADFGSKSGEVRPSSASSLRGRGSRVRAILLHDALAGASDISPIKIDVEGAEEQLLPEILRLDSPAAAIWLSLHPPFFSDKDRVVDMLLEAQAEFHIVDAEGISIAPPVVAGMIKSQEERPVGGTSHGNFFEVGLLPKRGFDATGERLAPAATWAERGPHREEAVPSPADPVSAEAYPTLGRRAATLSSKNGPDPHRFARSCFELGLKERDDLLVAVALKKHRAWFGEDAWYLRGRARLGLRRTGARSSAAISTSIGYLRDFRSFR